ncbi:MAG: ABC-F family ATP-binding cassette domain-containing protein [Anaerolineae bacterium]|nr:ABC-F family ATP-binding cassette domain-containing protein [Anaerolineae bacterium]
MSILTAKNVSLSYGAFDVFKGVNLSIPRDGKVGLIGPNGIGKTSLLLILAGINQPTTGHIQKAKNTRLGYLRQEAVDAFGDRLNSVHAEMLTAFAHLQKQQKRLHDLEAKMASGDYDEALLQSYGQAQSDFEHAGGYDYEQRIQQTLQGLGLGKETWEMPVNHLSGGQKTRALLARLLLEKPDLLMLDEPTNHLDLEAVEWLEHTLANWEGAFLIVSHDRYFLDNTVNTLWEMNRNGLESYSGNYSAYLQHRQERWEYTERVYEEEKARLLKTVDFIQRNWVRDSTHARALGKLRQISRELAIVENFGIMALRSGKQWSEFDLHVERHLDVIEAIRKVNAITLDNPRPPMMKPRLQPQARGGTFALRARELTVGYPGSELFQVQNLELRQGACVALIGPNGSGKTSFIKTLLGQLEPLAGEVEIGNSFKVGYFAQAHDSLSGERNILEELQQHKSLDQGAARSHLAAYLFRGEDVFKPLSALSGGERARLALAILALEGSNFLVLDEPTNHLDIPAREALQEVLEAFKGTILLVSHDRFLIDRLATQIWDLRDGRLAVFQGNYREFSLRQAGNSPSLLAGKAPPRNKVLVKIDGKQARQRSQALERLEARIHEHEQALQRLYKELERASQKQSYAQAQDLGQKTVKVQAELDDLMEEWSRLAED